MFNKNLKNRIEEINKNSEQDIASLYLKIDKLEKDILLALGTLKKETEANKQINDSVLAEIENNGEKLNIAIGILEVSTKANIEKLTNDLSLASENSLKNCNTISQKLTNELAIIRNDTNKQLTEMSQKYEDTIRHNFIITEEICKNNSLSLNKLNVEVGIIEKRILDSDTNIKTYIDAKVGILRSDIDKINLRITEQVQGLNSRIDAYIKEIPVLKDKVAELANFKVQVENKLDNLNRDIPGLREALKKNSDELFKFIGIEKTLNARIDLLEKSFEIQVNNSVEKRLNEYKGWINSEYYNIVSRMLSVLTPLLSKGVSDKDSQELNKLKAELSQKALEEKWQKDKQLKGQQILNKGVKIIENRQRIHDLIITKQKNGEYVDDLKQQIKVYDEILEVIK